LENHELLKTLGHSYLQAGKLEKSIFFFEKVLKLRPDEPHSKRDLALAYQENGEYQKALDLFYEILITDWEDIEDRFELIHSTVLYELNNLISTQSGLDLSEIDEELIVEMPVDIRIVLNWNALETDLDLWVIEPGGEKCYYKNTLTTQGGRFTEDYVDGYGPEEYLMKEAVQGTYKIQAQFYDDRVQKISGPVTLQVSIYTHYGSPNQKVQRITRELSEAKELIEIGTFNWKD